MAELQKFIPLKPDQIDMAFNPVRKSPVSAVVWVEGSDDRLRCKVTGYLEVSGNYFITLAKVPETVRFVQDLENQSVDTCLFNVNMPGDNLFFKGSYRRNPKGEINFRITEEVFKVQRRLHPRLPTDNYSIEVKVLIHAEQESAFTCEMLDISSGGTAIKAQEKDVRSLEIGNSFHSVEFTLKKQLIRCSAQLRFKMPLRYQNSEIYSQVKLGLLFQDLPSSDREVIEAFVFENSAKYFGRKG